MRRFLPFLPLLLLTLSACGPLPKSPDAATAQGADPGRHTPAQVQEPSAPHTMAPNTTTPTTTLPHTLAPNGDTAATQPASANPQLGPQLGDLPAAWGGQTLLGDRAKGNLTSTLEVVSGELTDGKGTVSVRTSLATVLLATETLLAGERTTKYTFADDSMHYQSQPQAVRNGSRNSISIQIQGNAVKVQLGGLLARAGHSIPEQMPSPWIVDEELLFSMQRLVQHLYPDGIPEEPEAKPRVIQAIVPALRGVREFRSRAMGKELLQLARARIATHRLQIEVADLRGVVHELWVDRSLTIVRSVRVWGDGVHRAVAHHLAAHGVGAGVSLTPLEKPTFLRPARDPVVDPLVWLYTTRPPEQRLVNRLLFEVAPQGVPIHLVNTGWGGSAEDWLRDPLRAEGTRTLVLHGAAVAHFPQPLAAAGKRFARVALVQPRRGSMTDEAFSALATLLRDRPLLVIWGEKSVQSAAFVAELRPQLPEATWEELTGVGDDFRGANATATYPDPLPEAFAAAMMRWLTRYRGDRR